VQFQDYYKTLGLSRDATVADIKRAYRKLARTSHPDLNKEKGAADRFKAINEANEVLSDPETRKRYDELGENWRTGQEFQPPPNWHEQFAERAGGSGAHSSRRSRAGQSTEMGGAEFSDFFESLFGRGAFGQSAGGGFTHAASQRPASLDTELEITVEEAFSGSTRTLAFSYIDYDSSGQDPSGRATQRQRTVKVKIPAGTKQGTVIRIAGEKGSGDNPGGPDILLHLSIASSNRYVVSGSDITMIVEISPAQAALGAKIAAQLPSGSVLLTVAPGAKSGQRLRLKGKGLPISATAAGDFYAELRIVAPADLSQRERELYQELVQIEQARSSQTTRSAA